jgi:hypothetical protein
VAPKKSERSGPPLRAPLVLHFEGKSFSRQRLSVRELVGFVSHLQTAVDRVALLLQGGSESVLKGRRPGEIESECALDVVSIQGGGSVTVVCDLPHPNQLKLPGFEDIGAEAVEALVGGIGQLEIADEALPDGFDKGVLLALREFGKPLESGEGRVGISLTVGSRHLTPSFTHVTYGQIVRRIQVPVKNRREVEGRLLMADFKETGLRCRIHPPAGKPIVCEFDEPQRESILSAMTHHVRIIGEATEVADEVKALRVEDVEILDGGGLSTIHPLLSMGATPPLPTLDELAGARGIEPIQNAESMKVDFWPEGEDLQDFLVTLRKWRRERRDDAPA